MDKGSYPHFFPVPISFLDLVIRTNWQFQRTLAQTIFGSSYISNLFNELPHFLWGYYNNIAQIHIFRALLLYIDSNQRKASLGKRNSTSFSVMLVQTKGYAFPRGNKNKIAHIHGHNFSIKSYSLEHLGQLKSNLT